MKLRTTLLLLILFTTVCNAQVPSWLWVKLTPYACGANAMATDKQGNIYIAASYEDTLTIAPFPQLTGKGYENIAVVKYDMNGNALWAKTATGNTNQNALTISVDGQGNVYVAGDFQSDTLSLDNIHLTRTSEYQDMFIAKYSTDGNLLWAKNFGDKQNNQMSEIIYGVAADSVGNSYLTGGFYGTLQVPPIVTSISSCSDVQETFLMKLDPNGNGVWLVKPTCSQAYSGSSTQGYSIALDRSGNLLISVLLAGTVTYIGTDSVRDINPHNSTLYNDSDAFVMCYTTTGNLKWYTVFDGGDITDPIHISSDNTNSWYVTGYHEASLTFPAFSLPAYGTLGQYGGFLVKLDSSGHAVWGINMGNTTYDQWVQDVVSDGHSNAYVAGIFQDSYNIEGLYDTINFDQYKPGLNAFYIAEVSPTGHITWAFSSRGFISQISIDGDQNLLASGNFTYYATFDSAFNFYYNSSNPVYYLAKYGMQITTSVLTPVQGEENVFLYPNPFNQSALLTMPGTAVNNSSSVLKIYDVLGKEARSIRVSQFPITIQRDGLPDGIYFYQLLGEGNITVEGKFVTGE